MIGKSKTDRWTPFDILLGIHTNEPEEKQRVRLNPKQSRHVDEAKKKALRRFQAEVRKRKRMEKQFLSDVNHNLMRINGQCAEILKVDARTLGRLKRAGQPEPTDAIDSHKQMMDTAQSIIHSSIRFGRFYERIQSFQMLQRLWGLGVISKVEFVKQHLKGRKISQAVALEYLDLSFGSGEKARSAFGEGISEATKKQYRNTLSKRIGSRKMKK